MAHHIPPEILSTRSIPQQHIIISPVLNSHDDYIINVSSSLEFCITGGASRVGHR